MDLNAICQIRSTMKTEKLTFGWVLASLFVAVGISFNSGKAGYRIRRIIEKGKRLLGLQGGMVR
jgi:hypothetical protein